MRAKKIRRPCSNCPWRVDAPRGYWDPQHFVDIWKHCQDDGLNFMLCHKALALPAQERQGVPCQGWIRVMGFEAIGVRLLALREQVTLEEINDQGGPVLFPTFAAMLRANKIPLPRRSRMTPQTRRTAPVRTSLPAKAPPMKITIRVHDCCVSIKGEDPGPHLVAIGYTPSGEELIRGTIHVGHSPSVQADAAAEVAGWIKKHRPGWNIETTPSEGVIIHGR